MLFAQFSRALQTLSRLMDSFLRATPALKARTRPPSLAPLRFAARQPGYSYCDESQSMCVVFVAEDLSSA